MLVFESQEQFDITLKKLKKMSSSERKNWQEKLGFKSFNRLISEIIDAEISYHEKFENLPEKQLKELVESGKYKKYSALTEKYLKKGIAKVALDSKK